MTKAEKIRSYTASRKSVKFSSNAMAKPKSTGITQRVGQVIESNYGVTAPVQTGNNNNGEYMEKSGKGGGWKEMLKNPVYYAVGVVMIVALFIAFKK
jgi:hypothetical protein